MSIIKALFIIAILPFGLNAQKDEDNVKKWTTETQFNIGYFHLGGYGKENPIYYLEQQVNYQINSKYSVGFGGGINLYPALLAAPLSVQGKYHFKIKNLPANIYQSYGYNLKLGKVFFKSSRYLGGIGLDLKSFSKFSLISNIGYALIWDKYTGASLSLTAGLGLKFK